MLIIKIEKNDSIDKALKVLKNKVIKTKQNNILFERKEYKKKSVVHRSKILKAIYIQKKKNN
jgi:ribosomal protein S21